MSEKRSVQFATNLWSSWVSLDPTKRAEVAQRLGPLGSILSIAANVHQLAKKVEAQGSTGDNAENVQFRQEAHSSRSDDDIIDVEFEETE